MSSKPRKDRLIQTRVDQDLESALKEEATRRRLPVSQLVRNILEDTLHLVGGVVDGVDGIVQDSVAMARRATADARRIARPRGGQDLSDVFAWNEVIVNQACDCSRCGTQLEVGKPAYVGMRDDPSRGRAWLCTSCIGALDGGGEGESPPEDAG
jgi:hypothetical protein